MNRRKFLATAIATALAPSLCPAGARPVIDLDAIFVQQFDHLVRRMYAARQVFDHQDIPYRLAFPEIDTVGSDACRKLADRLLSLA